MTCLPQAAGGTVQTLRASRPGRMSKSHGFGGWGVVCLGDVSLGNFFLGESTFRWAFPLVWNCPMHRGMKRA